MRSKLTIKAYIFPLLAIILSVISVAIIVENYPIDFSELRWIDYFMAILFTITFIWLIKFETIRKMIFIEISGNLFVLKNVLFNKINYSLNDLKGYKTQIKITKIGNYEETIILGNDNSKIILSELFLDNYREIKTALTNNLHDFGGPRKNAL